MKPIKPDLSALARMTNLSLTGDELDAYNGDFTKILAFIAQLQQADVTEIPVTNQVTDLENVYRPDEVETFQHRRVLIEQAGHHTDDLIQVPGVFSDGGKAHDE